MTQRFRIACMFDSYTPEMRAMAEKAGHHDATRKRSSVLTNAGRKLRKKDAKL